MLDALISSKTRIKLLLKFFLNPEASAYLRSLEGEFGESTNAIRLELNRFEGAGMLQASNEGNRKIFKANITHPLFNELRNIVVKHTGIDRIVEHVVERLGDLSCVYLTGDLAKGINTDVIDLVFVGDPDRVYLNNLVQKAEGMVDRKIRFLIYSEEEAQNKEFPREGYLVIWNSNNETK
jgi:hypothetical protein